MTRIEKILQLETLLEDLEKELGVNRAKVNELKDAEWCIENKISAAKDELAKIEDARFMETEDRGNELEF